MANTTNLNLSKLAGTEKLKSFPSPYNDNMDAIDGAFGSGFGVGSNSSVDDELNGLGKGMAIIANGNTHAAITSGEYVYVRQHASLSEGLYKATSNISANGTLSGSNLTAVSSGGMNDVYSTLNSKIDNITPTITGTTSANSNSTTIQYPAGKSKSNLFPIAVGFYHNTNWVFNGSSCQLSLTNSDIALELSSGFEYFRGLSFVIVYR